VHLQLIIQYVNDISTNYLTREEFFWYGERFSFWMEDKYNNIKVN